MKSFTDFEGMITGEPASQITASYSAHNFNIIDQGGYFEVRSGSQVYSNAVQGMFFAAAMTNLFSVNRKYPWITGDIVYLYGDVLPTPLQTNVPYYIIYNSPTTFYLANSYANSLLGNHIILSNVGSGTMSVRYGDINAIVDHVNQKVLVWMLGNTAYVSDKAISGYEKVLNLNGTDPVGLSMLAVHGNWAILASNTGIFKVVLNDTFYYMWKINVSAPSVLVADIPQGSPAASYPYGYDYIYSNSRLSGSGNRDRASGNATMELESATSFIENVDKDYGRCYFATAIGTVANLSTAHIIGPLVLPNDVNEATHFSLYRTKNISSTPDSTGVSGTGADATGIGNQLDYYVWDADVPVAKALLLDLSTDGHAKVVSGNGFVLGDVGSTIYTLGASAVITGFVSTTDVTIGSGLPGSSSQECNIGGGRYFQYAIQTGNVVQVDIMSQPFDPTDVGRTIFVSDGTRRYVTKYISQHQVQVAPGGSNFTGLSITMRQLDVNFSRVWNDTVPDDPQPDGRVSLMDRIDTGYDLYIPRRLFRPMPNGDILFVDDGFLIVAQRDGSDYYYSQYGDKEYTMGQYKLPIQTRNVNGTIRGVANFPYNAVLFCKEKTIGITLNSGGNVGNTAVGENVSQLPEPAIIDSMRGVVAWETIVFKNSGLLYALTNEPAYRSFNGSAWSADDYAMIGGLDAVSKEYLKKVDLSTQVNAIYNPAGGAKMWFRKWSNVNANANVVYRLVQMVTGVDQTTGGEIWEMSTDSFVENNPDLFYPAGILHDQQMQTF